MALGDYFNKNVQSAGTLLNGMQPDAFKAILEREVIAIAADEHAVTTAEGIALLDLTVRLVCRLYPTVVFVDVDGKAKAALATAATLAAAVNPSIEIKDAPAEFTKCIAIGKSRVRGADKAFVIYAGSNGWFARTSVSKPAGCGRSKNPFGAGAAACFAVANIFRSTFSEQLGHPKPDADLRFSVLDLRLADAKSKNPVLKTVDIGEFHLAGLGAIGNGFLWAFARLACRGDLHLIDPDELELSNLQRYAMTTREDVQKPKANLAQGWLAQCGVTPHVHQMDWERYAGTKGDRRFEHVGVAVDTEKTRINIQASLPKMVFNGWTSAGEFGVSWHRFTGQDACLACLYMPEKKTPNFDQILARALHLPEDNDTLIDLRRRLELNVPTDKAFLERIAAASQVALSDLLVFEGVSLREFYVRAICGGAVLAFGTAALQAQADVPMAFQSALAGIFLAADVVAHFASLRPRLDTITQLDLLRPVPPFLARSRTKHPRCICADTDFRAAYGAKYGTTEAA